MDTSYTLREVLCEFINELLHFPNVRFLYLDELFMQCRDPVFGDEFEVSL